MDIGGFALGAVAHGTPWAWPCVYLAGIVSSIGPCAAPRVLALGALVVRAKSPFAVGAAFLSGLLGTYVFFGFAGGLVGDLVKIGSWIYGFMAAAGIIGGLVVLWNADAHVHECAVADDTNRARGSGGMSGPFLSGIGFACMVSPCCTPLLGVILAYTSFVGRPLEGAGYLLLFGLGHATPLVGVLVGGRRLGGVLSRSKFSQIGQVVAGCLMMLLGAYYAVLV